VVDADRSGVQSRLSATASSSVCVVGRCAEIRVRRRRRVVAGRQAGCVELAVDCFSKINQRCNFRVLCFFFACRDRSIYFTDGG
jgi:hypothetical protein